MTFNQRQMPSACQVALCHGFKAKTFDYVPVTIHLDHMPHGHIIHSRSSRLVGTPALAQGSTSAFPAPIESNYMPSPPIAWSGHKTSISHTQPESESESESEPNRTHVNIQFSLRAATRLSFFLEISDLRFFKEVS